MPKKNFVIITKKMGAVPWNKSKMLDVMDGVAMTVNDVAQLLRVKDAD